MTLRLPSARMLGALACAAAGAFVGYYLGVCAGQEIEHCEAADYGDAMLLWRSLQPRKLRESRLLFTALLAHLHLTPRPGRPGQFRGAFVYIVKLQLKPGTTEEFLAKFKTLADYCRIHEPLTLTVRRLRTVAARGIVFDPCQRRPMLFFIQYR